MTFSVGKSRPFRSLGLYRSSGKHAAPRGTVQQTPRTAATGAAHRPAHAASMPRLTGPHADQKAATDRKAADEGAAAGEQQAA